MLCIKPVHDRYDSMKPAIRRTLIHDWPMIVLVLLNLGAIGLYLDVGPVELTAAGYRVIDTRAVERLLDSGELSRHEAQWYQRSNPSQKRSEE